MCFLIPLLAFLPLAAQAQPNAALTRYFSERLAQMDAGVASLQGGDDAHQAMQLEKISVAFRPAMSFGISEVLSLTVSPEIDFVLTPNGPNP